MSLPLSCCPPCTTPEVTEVPGVAGQAAYTLTTQSFTLPTIGTQVVVSVLNNQWVSINQILFICDGSASGSFQVFARPNGSTTSLVLTFLGYANDSAAGTSILTGAMVVPSGVAQNITLPLSLANGGLGQANATVAAVRAEILPTLQALTNFTDNTGGAATSTLAAGVGIYTLTFTTPLVNISAAAFVSVTPGHTFKVLSIAASVEVVDSTGAKLATVTPAIAGVSTTGGALALTSANMTPVGNVVSGTAITGANTGTAAQALTLVGSAVTPFVTGTAVISVKIQNMDTADALASIAAKINALQTGVGP